MIEFKPKIDFTDELISGFIEAVHSRKPVTGFTHSFYRYPARFSPLFARVVIKAFSQPGDVVFDPFMGGGTTLVEARALGRIAIGTDISSLATFVAKVKTTPLFSSDYSTLQNWADGLRDKLNIHNPPVRAVDWIEKGYQRNISGKHTWPIRKIMELALSQVDQLPNNRERQFARCVLLRTGQWALDCRKEIPTVEEFRLRFFSNFTEFLQGAKEFAGAVRNADRLFKSKSSCSFRTLCLNRSAVGIEKEPKVANVQSPKLILTSPPYPGIHILYHRWQVKGRKETPAAFWITNSLDGNCSSFYTFGDRHQKQLNDYYAQLNAAFASVAQIADHNTLLVQMVAFSDPIWQLPQYLHVMEQTGFTEVKFPFCTNSSDGRVWRCIPNRKWYANHSGAIASSKEVVLFHRLK